MTGPGTSDCALLVPCTLVKAVAWSKGWIGDVDLLRDDPATPEAVYFVTLPDLRAWRRVLPQFAELHRRGASVVILRTNTPTVMRHVEKWGGRKNFQDQSGRWRYLAPVAAVEHYFGRMAQNSAAASLVTTSR